MIAEYLNNVKSDKKALELAAILEAIHPSHSERLWLCGFLKYVGYPMTEVLDIIHQHNHWVDYDEKNTAQQVASVFHQRQVGTINHKKRMTLRVRKWDLTPVEVLRIRRQKSIDLSKILCEENKVIEYPHPEQVGDFNSWAEFLRK
jgi:hypothetical protein